MEQFNHTDELYHHGIKGMRWGVRRFQNKDGSLTPAGEKRYNELSDSDKKSKHRTKLEERFKREGMSSKEATIAADRRIRTEKILASVAGVTIAAASAYLVTQHIRERTDQIVKAGSDFQRIEGTRKLFGKNRNLHDSFYVTDNAYDNKNYQDAFGFMKKTHYGTAYKLNIKATDDIKIASQKKARDTLRDLMANNEEFRDATYRGYFAKDLRGEHRISEAQLSRALKGQKVSDSTMRRIYDNFNSNLVGKPDDRDDTRSRKIFYDALKKQGYGGIQDINDLKWSKLRGKNPLIIFDKGKVSVDKIENIMDEVNSKVSLSAYDRMKKLRQSQAVTRALPKIATMSVGTAAAYYMSGTKVSTKNAVKRYRKDHPNSKLTDREIKTMLNTKK